MRTLLLLATLVVGLGGALRAQGVVVAPHAVYLDHRTRSTSITLYNPNAEPAEVAISTAFGYPVTDSLGEFTLAEPDSVTDLMPSAARWIEAFPKRMVIPPLARQTVRLLARPAAGLADGEYWSRVVISAKGGSLPVRSVDTAGIQIGLSLEMRTNIPLTYRKGPLQTGLTLSALRAAPAGDSLRVRVRAERQGTAAYVGTARGMLIDAQGRTVASTSEPVAVYITAEPVFALPISGLPPGRYTLRFEFTSERADIMPELLLRAPPVRDSVEVVLP